MAGLKYCAQPPAALFHHSANDLRTLVEVTLTAEWNEHLAFPAAECQDGR